jgi:hypothetical protein
VPVLFPMLEELLISTFSIVLSSSSDANLRPFMGLFSFGNRKNLQGVKSGEYGVIDQKTMNKQ